MWQTGGKPNTKTSTMISVFVPERDHQFELSREDFSEDINIVLGQAKSFCERGVSRSGLVRRVIFKTFSNVKAALAVRPESRQRERRIHGSDGFSFVEHNVSQLIA